MRAFLLKAIVPLLVAALGLGIGWWFHANPDEAKKRPKPEAQALLVETDRPGQGDFSAVITAMGQVRPATEVTLKAQVAGEILSASGEFVPGGFFSKGEEILKVDPADYDLAVRAHEAALKQAEADYSLEQGRQAVAKDELKILQRATGKRPKDTALALRKPQLDQAQAGVDKARSDLDRARLDLSRTAVRAPFNALVTHRMATPGDKVAVGGALATLVDTDSYWVEVSVPVTDLRWLDLPRGGQKGSAATIVMDGGRGTREGYLYRLTGTLDADSRLATILVAVDDPLLRREEGAGAPLILSDYVQVRIEGRRLDGALRVPRGWVRDGGVVWVNAGGHMEFRPVEIAYEDDAFAYIAKGIAPDDDIITSNVSVPVENMKIRTAQESP